MNSQETMNAVRQFLTAFFAALTVAVPSLAMSPNYSAVTNGIIAAVPALCTIASIVWSIYAHWNMKKVPETATAVVLPGGVQPAPGTAINLAPMTGVAKVVGVFLVGAIVTAFACSLPSGAYAQGNGWGTTQKPVTLKPATPAAPAALSSVVAQQNPLLLLQKFTADDLRAALADANAQTPPDTVAAACYSALLPLVQSNASPLTMPQGVFSAFQKARDIKALIANLQSPNGPLSSLNVACAPLLIDAQTTLIQLGILGGVVLK